MADWVSTVDLVAILILAGWVSAFIVQLIKQVSWPSWVKLVLSWVVAALVGLATIWQGGQLSSFIDKWGDWVATDIVSIVVLVFTAAQIWYTKFFAQQNWAITLGRWPRGGE